jgi:hypothetical protein
MVSCSKDDNNNDNQPTQTLFWTDGAGDYSPSSTSNKLTLPQLSGALDLTAGRAVSLAKEEADTTKAQLSLTNFFPEQAKVVFDNVDMTQGTDGTSYSFTASTTIDGDTLAATGTLKGIGSANKELSLTTRRGVNAFSPLVGTWQLTFDPTTKAADVFLKVNTGDAATDTQYGMMGSLLGGAIAAKVKEVDVYLTQDGLFDFKWMPVDTDGLVGMPAAVKAMGVTIPYYITNNNSTLNIAIDKNLIPLLGQLVSTLGAGNPALKDLDLTTLIPALVQAKVILDQGGFYAIPLQASASGNTAQFFVGKDMLAPLMTALSPMLSGLLTSLPADEQAAIGQILQSLPTVIGSASQFDFGLGFTKAAN